MIAGKPYLMGDAFSVADAYLFNVLRWTGFHKIDLAPWPNIQAFFNRVQERPQVQAAMRAEGFVTVAALSAEDTPESLRSSHVLQEGRAVALPRKG